MGNCGIFLQVEIILITKIFEDRIEPEISYQLYLLTIHNFIVPTIKNFLVAVIHI